MMPRAIDFAIVGGGLAGGLIALALRRARPDLSIALFEDGDMLGGNHRWSWFASDLDPRGSALMAGFRQTVWPGYEVRFPAHSRQMATPYHSLASHDFDAALRLELAQDTVRHGTAVAGLAQDGVTLANGEHIAAKAVIDCRGFAPSAHLTGGWQVFMGRHLRTTAPHRLARPVIMDAAVPQLGGYRFVYVLPLGPDELFVEDTYYQETPLLDRSVLSARLDDYCRAHGWHGTELGSEIGVLPVVTGGDAAAYLAQVRTPGVALAGARGLMAHPLTSYTLPFAVATAGIIAANADLPGDRLAALLENHSFRVWQRTAYYRLLGRMLFGAAEPAERYRIFERFYRLPAPLVERFYAARSTFADKARVLAGRPPVPVTAAVRALLGKGAPLVHGGAR